MPQGTVLGPLLLIIFIGDLDMITMKIKEHEDTVTFPKNLNSVYKWAENQRKQDAEGIQNMSGVYLIGLNFIK